MQDWLPVVASMRKQKQKSTIITYKYAYMHCTPKKKTIFWFWHETGRTSSISHRYLWVRQAKFVGVPHKCLIEEWINAKKNFPLEGVMLVKWGDSSANIAALFARNLHLDVCSLIGPKIKELKPLKRNEHWADLSAAFIHTYVAKWSVVVMEKRGMT